MPEQIWSMFFSIWFWRLLDLPRQFLSNSLALVPPDKQPQTYTVGPQIRLMEKSISELDSVILKLVRPFVLSFAATRRIYQAERLSAKTISQNKRCDREHGKPPFRRLQCQRLAMGPRGAIMGNMAYGEIWFVAGHWRHSSIRTNTQP